MTTTVLPGVLVRFLAERPRVVVEVLSGPYGAIEQMVQARPPISASSGCPPRTRASTSARSCAATSRA